MQECLQKYIAMSIIKQRLKEKNMHKNTKKCISGRGYKTYGDNYITR